MKFLRKSDERKNAVVDNNMDALAWLRKQLGGGRERVWSMGMVMYVRAVSPADVPGLAADTDALAELLTDDEGSWEADKLWWAALGLLFGPEGPGALVAEPITEEMGYTPVMRIAHGDVQQLVVRLADVDQAELCERFDHRALGEPVGPDVIDDDRDWLTEAAARLADLFRTAGTAGDDVLFVVA